MKPRTLRFGPTTGKGYESKDFAESFERYLPDSAQVPTRSVTPSQPNDFRELDDSSSVTVDDRVTDGEARNRVESQDCYGVTVRDGEAAAAAQSFLSDGDREVF